MAKKKGRENRDAGPCWRGAGATKAGATVARAGRGGWLGGLQRKARRLDRRAQRAASTSKIDAIYMPQTP